MLEAFVTLLVFAQVVLPRRYAFVPLLVAACHTGNSKVLSELTPCRILIIAGLLRAIVSGGFRWSWRVPLDRVVVVLAAVALAVSIFPRLDVPSSLSQSLGLILNVVGTYLYGRAYLHDSEAVTRFATALAVTFIPLAVLMSVEKATARNPYFALGARGEGVIQREGKNRARGPFAHPILAGTAGATTLPLMGVLWRRRRSLSLTGIGACVLGVLASSSSGPLAAVGAGLVALALWRLREHILGIKRWVIALLVVLHLVSNRGVWYLMSYIDLAGGSTGYFRARLIDSALENFSTWWLKGTDYTRDWMATGVSWNERHTDMTNYYIHLGVIGGIGLTGAVIALFIISFSSIGRVFLDSAVQSEVEPERYGTTFDAWCVGSALFAHAVSCVSISYFDQMFVPLYLTIALVAGFKRSVGPEKRTPVDDLQSSDGMLDGSRLSVVGNNAS
ncbi:MAG: hypothetical protein QOE70_6120 [Chthoniobacter sp.]|jgi:hypothetical protein|nr:hypothetical protein [Chthoniobacter sp.]